MPSTPIAVPSARDTTVSARCTPKNAVMPACHDRGSFQMFFRNLGQMTQLHTPKATRNQATRFEIVGPYDADTIRRLKQQADGNVYISGSGTLVRALLADGLVDELHLFVYPVILGDGARLFADGSEHTTLTLSAHEAYDNGVLHLTYAQTS